MFTFFCDMRQKQSRLRRKPPLIRRVREDALRVCEADGFRFVPAKADPARARGSFHTKRYADLSRLHVNMGHRDTSLLRALDKYVRNLPRRSKLFLQLILLYQLLRGAFSISVVMRRGYSRAFPVLPHWQAGACTPLWGLRPQVGILLRKIITHVPPPDP